MPGSLVAAFLAGMIAMVVIQGAVAIYLVTAYKANPANKEHDFEW